MTYLEKRKDGQGRKIAGIVAVFAFVLFGLVQFFAPHIFSSIFTSIVTPFWRTEFSINSGSLLSPADLLRENEALKQELLSDQVRMNSSEYLDFENSELRSLLNKASSTPKILAAVLQRSPLSAYDELIIDAGLDRKLSTTSVIYAAGNIPIGRVIDVFDQTAKVLLFSSPGQKQDVLIGPEHFPSTATGRGGGQYEAELPRGTNVAVGTFVIASGLDARPMGTVLSIDANTALPFQKILFASPVNIYELRWVLVDNGNSNIIKKR